MLYATRLEPFWFDVCEVSVPVKNLPAALEGYRISHLTDLHASDTVPLPHLEKACEIALSQKPDIVVVTGDLVTHTYDYIDPVAQMLKSMNLPVFVSFGNHDYVPWGASPGPDTILAECMQRELERAGCVVLRNRSVSLERNGVRFWITGLEDAYTDFFNPPMAFADRVAGETTICLSHNPDTVEDLLAFKPDVILSGHTHGGQIRVPLLGAPMLPIFHRKRNKGLWKLPCGHLYVSRGVGFLLHARFWCRPEIPLIVLKRET
jgi:predicted MPP superfamily phosphohydrolase